ncbi:MAG: DUF4422 domain-containing protein [Clostridia bacterium]|nr:DUF4422 domain-containing protein [Clostridia bacterium]
MSVRIFIMTHKQFDHPKNPMYQPLHVGHAKAADLGYMGDDTGDHISELNCYYSELTGIYWIWKNYHAADYVGVCHYRRYLIKESGKTFTAADCERILKDYDLITTKKVELNFSYHYGFGENHNVEALDETGRVIAELYPEYYETFLKLVNENKTYFGNIMITSKAHFDAYAEWLFSIFFVVQKRIDLSAPDDYHRRVFGFISEFLLYVYVTYHRWRAYECKVGMIGEKAETKELKQCLAQFFLKRDAEGAKQYFDDILKKRPDVMMEASDITGELRLSMQTIATARQEVQNGLPVILDHYQDFEQLMHFFSTLNRIVSHYLNQEATDHDLKWICTEPVTFIGIEISALMQTSDRKAISRCFKRIAKDCDKEELAQLLMERARSYE